MEKIVGKAFEELTKDEMEKIQGTGDIQPETTPICGFTIGIGIGALASVKWC